MPRLIIADNDNNELAVPVIFILVMVADDDTKDIAAIIEEYTVISIGINETISIFDIPLII
jgi:hypothetical protein